VKQNGKKEKSCKKEEEGYKEKEEIG